MQMTPDQQRTELGHPAASYWRFFVAGLINQGQMGALVPSQRFLIDKMIQPVPRGYRGQIVELGAGTGALTLRLATRRPKARILACEINPALARDLRAKVSAAGLEHRVEVALTPAERLLAERAQQGFKPPEFIISGIPLGTLNRHEAKALIELIHGALGKGGFYIQFQHSLLDQGKIRAVFSRLRTEPVLLNFPPAFVYYAQK
jgi:phospholipid N-methyltransferase